MGRAIHKLTALQVAKMAATGLHLDGGRALSRRDRDRVKEMDLPL
jgi:hypothetical protein